MHREGPIVFEGKASEVRHHVIRSLRRMAIEPRVLEAPDEKVPFLLVHRGQIPVVGLGEAEGHGRRDLQRMGRSNGQEVVGPAHRMGEGLRCNGPSDPPAGRAVRLRESVDRDRPIRHVPDRRQGDVLRAIEDDVLVDLVRHRDGVVVGTEIGDQFEFLAAEDFPRRIVRRVQDQDLRAVREGGLQLLLIHGPIRPFHPDIPWAGPADDRVGPVVLVERFEDHGLVAGVDEGEHGRHHRLRRAAGDDQVRLRIGVDPVEGLRPTSDRVPQFLRAPGDGVLVVARVEGALRRIGELARRVEVRVALGQVDRVVERGDAGHLPDHRLREFLDAVGEPGILDRQVGAASASGWGDAAPLRRGKEEARKNLSDQH